MRMRFLKKTGLYGKLMLLAIIMLMAMAVQPILHLTTILSLKILMWT